MKKVILFALTCILLMSCGHHRDGTSVWAGGLWIIGLFPAAGAIIWFRTAYLSHKSGSNKIDSSGKITNEEGGIIPIYKIPFFWYAVVCVIALAVFIFVVNAEK